MRKQTFIPTHSSRWHQEAIGQLHAPVAVHQEKEPFIPIEQEAWFGPRAAMDSFGEENP